MQGSYYVHNPNHWSSDDFKALQVTLGKQYDFDLAAARGEGAGGAGFDTLVEFVIRGITL